MEEIARHRCIGDDGTALVVLEYRYIFTTESEAGVRRHPGSAWLSLLDGEPVRYLDPATFEVTSSGELLRKAG